jgi:transcription elongation factor
VEGGEKGLTGVVKDVNNGNVTVCLSALPGQLSIVELYKSKQLEKYFAVGDHVVIVAGKHKV